MGVGVLTALGTELGLEFERVYGYEGVFCVVAVSIAMQACRPLLEDAEGGSGTRTRVGRRARTEVARRVKVVL